MGCKCKTTIIPKKPDCSGCLVVNDLLVGCSDGPYPCGIDLMSIDLGEKNDLTACTGTPVWTIKSYDIKGLKDVSLSQSGILQFKTKNYYKDKDFLIIYQVDCPNSNLRAEGVIKICMKDPCTNGCDQCNPCSGNCITSDDASIIATITNTGCVSVNNTFDLKTITSYSDCGTNITYNLTYLNTIFDNVSVTNGVLSFTIKNEAVSGGIYDIKYDMICPDYDIKVSGIIHVETRSKCYGVSCSSTENCNLCTGLCEPIGNEVEINSNLSLS